MNNDMIVSFSHSNYMINSYGTEKFIRELSTTLRDEGYHHLNFFSFYHQYGKIAVGVNYDDQFRGIYDYNDIFDIIDWYEKKENISLRAIHVQHLLNHKIDYIEDIIHQYNVPVYLFVHDFFVVCNNYKMIDSNNHFCGISKPDYDKCRHCKNKDNGINHYQKMKSFIKSIDANLVSIVTPSKFVAEGIENLFEEQKDKVVVRPHLCNEGHWTRPLISNKVKIAYAGLQVSDKGYDTWKKLVECLGNIKEYEFYYFGTGNDRIEGVKNIYVSVAEQGEDAMEKALKNELIDVALMWTMCPETYSFVYYEMSVCGIYILSNVNSGNICREIKNNKNGKVFNSLEECINMLEDFEAIKACLNRYRATPTSFCPKFVKKNTSLGELIPTIKVEKNFMSERIKRPNRKVIKTMAYLMKHYRKF